MSQAAVTAGNRGGGPSAARSAPSGAAPRSAGPSAIRRRRTSSSSSTGTAAGNMLRFYTDDAPGLKITPTVVLVMSLCFIGFVTGLHVIGKLYGYSK